MHEPEEKLGPKPFVGTPRPRPANSDQVLEKAFGSPVPATESALWAAMSFEQRAKALKRLRVMVAMDDPATVSAMGLPTSYFEHGPVMNEVAKVLGVSLNRLYEMRAAWKQNRSLASLGTFAANPRTRVIPYHNDLQELAVQVLDAHPGETSVRKLALALAAAYGERTGLPESDWPSHNTMRKFVESERRLRTRTDQAGIDVQFDCCACELPHSDAIFVAFLVIDRNTSLPLGAALGHLDDSRSGYAAAASDALTRIAAAPLDALPWADRLVRSELVMGRDVTSWDGLKEEVGGAGLLKFSTPMRRFRPFGRQHIGERLGRVKFLPGRTKDVAAVKATAEDIERLGVEVDLYNAQIAPVFATDERSVPPSSLVALLKKLANS